MCLSNYFRTSFGLCAGNTSKYLVSCIRLHFFTSTSGGFFIFHLTNMGSTSNAIVLRLIDRMSFRILLIILPILLLSHVGHGFGSCDDIQVNTSLGLQLGFAFMYLAICCRCHDFSLISTGLEVSQA